MFENNKNYCEDTLIVGLNRGSHWRKRLAVRYPSDLRNAVASQCLATLATEASHKLTHDEWLQLKPHSGWANETFREAISEATRAVGFTSTIKDFHSFIEHLLEVLSQLPHSVAA
jgi:small-conductance mechanosensitive channel